MVISSHTAVVPHEEVTRNQNNDHGQVDTSEIFSTYQFNMAVNIPERRAGEMAPTFLQPKNRWIQTN